MQRVMGLCKATGPSLPGSPGPPARSGKGVSGPLEVGDPPVLPRYLSTSAGWRSALSSPGPARCTEYLGWGENIASCRGGAVRGGQGAAALLGMRWSKGQGQGGPGTGGGMRAKSGTASQVILRLGF